MSTIVTEQPATVRETHSCPPWCVIEHDLSEDPRRKPVHQSLPSSAVRVPTASLTNASSAHLISYDDEPCKRMIINGEAYTLEAAVQHAEGILRLVESAHTSPRPTASGGTLSERLARSAGRA